MNRLLSFHGLERRMMPATFVVTTTADSGPGSLRAAILGVDGDATPDTIQFTVGTGAQSIALASPLQTVTNSVTIDGTTQPGYAGAPLIELNGAGAGASVDGLVLSAGNSAVKGLVINRFSGNGVVLLGGSNDAITGNYIGTDASGIVARPNLTGVVIESGASGNTVGGATAGAGNVISGNLGNGVLISGAAATGNVIAGNRIGTNAAGDSALANAGSGVLLDGAPNNTVGGTTAAARNVISGNTGVGVFVHGSTASGNLVEGNYIGTNAAGAAAVGNGVDGVLISANAGGNTVGGTTAAARNLISGNAGAGVELKTLGVLPGTVAWWRGDGDATDVLGANDGQLRNGATFGPGVVSGQAFRFDGPNDYFQVLAPNSSHFDLTGDLTLEAWVRFDTAGPGDAQRGGARGVGADQVPFDEVRRRGRADDGDAEAGVARDDVSRPGAGGGGE
ncbi:MAG: hypothetical protein LC745_00255, partial [Planctomycetia bacterium]|nr:hypothetical protein [Planctomycetia bacterium]